MSTAPIFQSEVAELKAFHKALGALLAEQKPRLASRDRDERRRASRLFLQMRPVHRDLGAWLYQRGAATSFRPSLEQLAQVILSEVVHRLSYVSQTTSGMPGFDELPLSASLVRKLAHTGVSSPAWLVVLGRMARAPNALAHFEGSTIREMAADYQARAMVEYRGRNARIQGILGRIEQALGAEDFAFLKAHLDIGELHRYRAS